MKITRTSQYSGIAHTVEMNLPVDSFRRWLRQQYDRGAHAGMLNTISHEEFEFLMTGITPAEWDEMERLS